MTFKFLLAVVFVIMVLVLSGKILVLFVQGFVERKLLMGEAMDMAFAIHLKEAKKQLRWWDALVSACNKAGVLIELHEKETGKVYRWSSADDSIKVVGKFVIIDNGDHTPDLDNRDACDGISDFSGNFGSSASPVQEGEKNIPRLQCIPGGKKEIN